MSAIGIDLGTTYSCVAVYRNKAIECIANDASGSRVTPSCVSFNDEERLVGETAKQEVSSNPENTLYQIKRLIGRKFNDSTVQDDMKLWGFKVINYGGKPKLKVTYKNETKTFYPEEISAMVLADLKETAEAYMGESITDAVITVPAYFNDAQRTATRDAGKIAGLNVLSMINEPTAAAIAFGLDRKSDQERNVLIFDLGGGTFDVTIVTIEDQIFDVKATGGDTHLGGEDFDNRLVKHFIEEFNRKHDVDMSNNRRSVSRLRVACEAAKRKLSSSLDAKIQVDGMYNGLDFKTTLRQAKFEDMNLDLFTSTITCVEKVLKDAKMTKKQIDEIVLVGGSTRIPKIRKLLEEFFDGKKLSKEVNADEAVARGAAVLANNIKSGKGSVEEKFKVKLMDVTPLSIGLCVEGTIMRTLIPRNTKIPTKAFGSFTTGRNNQTAADFKVYEGERFLTADNHLLGSFELTGIPPAPEGVPELTSVFEIDRSGILTVTARDEASGSQNSMKITNEERQLADEEIKRMIASAEKFKQEDLELKARTEAKNELEGLICEFNKVLESDSSTMSVGDRLRLIKRSEDAMKWANSNKDLETAKIKEKTTELRTIFNFMHS